VVVGVAGVGEEVVVVGQVEQGVVDGGPLQAHAALRQTVPTPVMNIVGIAVVDTGVPVVVGGGGDPGGDVLLLQLSLDPQRLHLVHLRDTLAEVFNELGSVMIVPGVESDDDLPVPALGERDAVGVVAVLKQRHQHACERKAVSEGVGDAVLPPGVDLGDDQDVVEEEHLPLMLTWPVFLVFVLDLVEPAVADQAPVGDGQVRTLHHDGLLNFHHLSDMI